MSAWLTEYLSTLEARDTREKALTKQIDAYTKLADRTASLGKNNDGPAESPATVPRSPQSQPGTLLKGKHKSAKEDATTAPTGLLSRLRADLATTQRSRAELHKKVSVISEELEQLKVQNVRDTRSIGELKREKAALERRVKDRDEELRGKSAIVENAHNEMVSLNLQLHMVEKRSEKLERENKELIDRWMTRMGQEADAMNHASKWS